MLATHDRSSTAGLHQRDCPPPDPNNFGGVPGCITITPPSATTSTLPSDAVLSVVTISATSTSNGAQPVTTSITWLSTNVPMTTTDNMGMQTTTQVPAWMCVGDLCNPACIVPVQSCSGQDGPGINGFPFPPV